jgi:prepilin-type N-terminal cleavage/methylation domain-containing protein
MRAPERRAGGFTLVEVLVTLAITGVLLSLVGSILVSFLSTQQKVEATLLRERVGSSMLELVAKDVQAIYAFDCVQAPFKGTDERAGPGDADSFEFVTVREPAVRDFSDPSDPASTGPSTGLTGLPGDPPPPEDPPRLSRVGYIARTSSTDSNYLTIFRSEVPLTPQPKPSGPSTAPQQPGMDAQYMEVYDRVKSFNVRYLYEDKVQGLREWRDQWQAKDWPTPPPNPTPTTGTAKRDPEFFPAAVEITIEIAADPRSARGEGDERPRKIYKSVLPIVVTQ